MASPPPGLSPQQTQQWASDQTARMRAQGQNPAWFGFGPQHDTGQPMPGGAGQRTPGAAYSAYSPQQAQPRQDFRQYGQAAVPLPTFQFNATDFMGNTFNNPAAFTAQQGAMAQALNQQRAQQVDRGRPGVLNPIAAYQSGQQMVQQGWQNPFGPSPQSLASQSFPSQYQPPAPPAAPAQSRPDPRIAWQDGAPGYFDLGSATNPANQSFRGTLGGPGTFRPFTPEEQARLGAGGAPDQPPRATPPPPGMAQPVQRPDEFATLPGAGPSLPPAVMQRGGVRPEPTPGYGTPPDQRGGPRLMQFLDRDGDGVDDRDQDGPGMPRYGQPPRQGAWGLPGFPREPGPLDPRLMGVIRPRVDQPGPGMPHYLHGQPPRQGAWGLPGFPSDPGPPRATPPSPVQQWGLPGFPVGGSPPVAGMPRTQPMIDQPGPAIQPIRRRPSAAPTPPRAGAPTAPPRPTSVQWTGDRWVGLGVTGSDGRPATFTPRQLESVWGRGPIFVPRDPSKPTGWGKTLYPGQPGYAAAAAQRRR